MLNELNSKKELLADAEYYLLKSLEDLNDNFQFIKTI